MGNLAISSDNKILLWVLGAIPNLIQIANDSVIATATSDTISDASNIERGEYALFALWRASIDCEDV